MKLQRNMNRAAIYALFKDEKIVYIGQSINAYSRIGSHNKDKDFDHFRIMPCLKRRMNNWEEMLIQRYKPKYNKQGLKKSFTPMYRKSDRQKDRIQNNRVVDMREYGGGITFRSNTHTGGGFHTTSSGASLFIDSGSALTSIGYPDWTTKELKKNFERCKNKLRRES